MPGIDFSPDPLLAGRNFSYFDTQLSRLGINWEELPINRPICPVMNFNRDGQGRHTITKGTVNYWPNRFEANPPTSHTKSQGGFQSYPSVEAGMKARMLTPKWKDYVSQAQAFYNSLAPVEKMHLTNAFSFELDHCDDPVVYERMVERLTEVDLSLAQAVAEKCGAPTPTKQTTPNHGKTLKGVSQFEHMPKTPTIASRRIAILIADGYNHSEYAAIKAAVKAQSALPFTIAPKRQPVKSADGSNSAQPDHFLNGMRSTMFDAVYVPGGEQSVKTLSSIGLARFWVREAFGHCKAIGATSEGIKLVDVAVKEAEGVTLASKSGEVVEWYGVVTEQTPKADSLGETVKMAKGAKDFISNFFYQISQHRNWAREVDGLADQVTM